MTLSTTQYFVEALSVVALSGVKLAWPDVAMLPLRSTILSPGDFICSAAIVCMNCELRREGGMPCRNIDNYFRQRVAVLFGAGCELLTEGVICVKGSLQTRPGQGTTYQGC